MATISTPHLVGYSFKEVDSKISVEFFDFSKTSIFEITSEEMATLVADELIDHSRDIEGLHRYLFSAGICPDDTNLMSIEELDRTIDNVKPSVLRNNFQSLLSQFDHEISALESQTAVVQDLKRVQSLLKGKRPSAIMEAAAEVLESGPYGELVSKPLIPLCNDLHERLVEYQKLPGAEDINGYLALPVAPRLDNPNQALKKSGPAPGGLDR